MKNKLVCDICGGDSIRIRYNIFPPASDRFTVKIKHIKDEVSMRYKDNRKLDVCPDCMEKFIAFVNGAVKEKEKENVPIGGSAGNRMEK